MRFKHKTMLLVLPVLLLAFAFSGCDDGSSNPGGGTGGEDNPQNELVSSVSINLSSQTLEGHFGATDTLSFEVTARNSSSEAVENATITVTTVPSYGKVIFPDGNTTNASGIVSGKYILTYTGSGSDVWNVGVANVDLENDVTFTIEAEDVTLVAVSDGDDNVVVAGATATSDITMRVLDTENQAVDDVPVALQIVSGTGAILTTPSFNDLENTYTSTLSATIPDTSTSLTVSLRAYIKLPAGVSIQSTGKTTTLPVIMPGRTNPTLDSETGDSGADTPMIDSARPLTGKAASELQTWDAGDGPGDKGLGAGIAESVTEAMVDVTWTTWGSTVSNLNVQVTPSLMKVLPDSSGTATVKITASDENNNGIQGLQTYLTLVNTVAGDPVGTITIPDTTGANGVTTATISTNGHYGTWQIQARVNPGDDDPTLATMTVEEGSNVTNAYLAVDPGVLYVEPGVSAQATVTAIAFDDDNNAVPAYGLYMRLSDTNGNPVGGTIAPPDTTDASGLTTTTISTNGAYGDWMVEVYPYKNSGAPLATANFSVQEGSSIASIAMTVNPDEVLAEPGANKQVNVRTTAKDANNNGLRNRQIFFSLRNPDNPGAVGSISESDTTDSAGVTNVTINTDGEFGDWLVEARAYPTQASAMVSRPLTVTEGTSVSEIVMTITPDLLTPSPETTDTATVNIIARDLGGSGVADAELHLSMRNIIPGQLTGSLSQPDSTGPNGATSSQILTAGRYGTWIVEARPYAGAEILARDTLQVLEGSASYIAASVDTSKIAVRGTNGLEQTTLDATIYDENDIPLQDGSTVHFVAQQFAWTDTSEFRFRINGNNGSNTPDMVDGFDLTDPNTDDYNLPYASAVVNNGVASVTLRSGSDVGPVRIFIWSMIDDGQGNMTAITNIFNGVSVVAGPPAHIEVGYNPTGQQAGSGLWNMEIDARIVDARDNEVLPGYEVWFTVEPNIATVWNQDVFTGNTGVISDQTTPGVAYSIMSYHGEFTYQDISVTGHVLDADGLEITDDLSFELPLQEAQGTLTISPRNYYFGMNNNEPGVFDMIVHVYDGYGTPINDAVVLFSPDRGGVFEEDDADPDNDEQNPFGRTGINDFPTGQDTPPVDPLGISIRYLIFTLATAFPGDEPYVSVNVGATVVGVLDVTIEPDNVWLYR